MILPREQSVAVVDELACERVAAILSARDLPAEEEQSNLPDLPRDLVPNFLFLLVAISHQTSPRQSDPLEGFVRGVYRRGWEYLFAKLESVATDDNVVLNPRFWVEVDSNYVQKTFHDERLGDRLTGEARRASLIRDLGKRMTTAGWTSADEIYRHCEGRVRTGTPNLLDTLRSFRAYQDPVMKKSFFFLSLMNTTCSWRYRDPESVGPPIDYHELRGHLRLGTVKLSAGLEQEIRLGKTVAEEVDVAMRAAVLEAIQLIQRIARVQRSSQLHYLFWHVFRSVCTREAPQCLEFDRPSSLPERYLSLTETAGVRKCPFADTCPSAKSDERLLDPYVDTDFY